MGRDPKKSGSARRTYTEQSKTDSCAAIFSPTRIHAHRSGRHITPDLHRPAGHHERHIPFTRAGGIARRRAEAGALAESKLNELIATGEWQSNLQGDFGTDDAWKDYTWTAELNPWSQSMGVNGTNVIQELDLHVNWKEGNTPQQSTVSTLVYQSASSQGVLQ